MRQALILVALVSMISGTVLADAAAAQQTLTGQVVDGSGEPLVQVEVALEAHGDGPTRTLTEGFGRFEFVNVSPGIHQIIIELPGYEGVRQTVFGAGWGSTRIVVNRLRTPEETYRPAGDYVIDIGQFLENFPDEAIDHYKKGLKAKKKGQSQSAIQHLEEAVRLAPSFFAARSASVVVSMMRNRNTCSLDT